MTKEDALVWLTQLGTDWVGLHEVYRVFEGKDDGHLALWDWLNQAHDAAHIGKRINIRVFEQGNKNSEWNGGLEQWRLNKRAIALLEE